MEIHVIPAISVIRGICGIHEIHEIGIHAGSWVGISLANWFGNGYLHETKYIIYFYIHLYTFRKYHNRPQNCHCAPLFSRDLNSDRSWNHFFRDYFGSDISRKWPTEVMGLARVGYSLCSALEKKVEVIQPECGKPTKSLPIQVRLLGWLGKYMVNIW